ncbi:MAG TPA: (2Fe-2S)-binding protein [Candidatus Bathyarchaeota archaeon]|nr:(2Fe-2S)-binding protein [Candidatus Bathyarchaeota archaeon]
MSDVIVCRCRDVTLEMVEKAIDEGYKTVEELKRKLRLGMGPCQGRTCMRLLAGILRRKAGLKPEAIKQHKIRPPVRPVPVGVLEAEAYEGED